MTYLPALDGVRALAILLVALLHYKIIYFGWIGVQLFFVLSGFLITNILSAEKSKPLGEYLEKFYRHRALRIFPAYFLCVFLFGLTCFIWGHPAPFFRDLPGLASFTYNFSVLSKEFKLQFFYVHFWSLSVEIQFYLLIPWAIYFLDRKKLKRLIFFLFIFSPCARFLLAEYLKADRPDFLAGVGVNWFTLSHLDAFAFGAAIEIFELRKIRRPARFFAAGAILFLLAGILMWHFTGRQGGARFVLTLGYRYYETRGLQHVWSYTLINAVGALLVLCALDRDRNLIQAALSTRFLREVGKVSYGMYLYNFVLLLGWTRLFHIELGRGTIPWTFLPYFAALYFFSWLSYRFFESRFFVFKRAK